MSKDTKAPFHPAMHNGSTLPGSNGLTKREWYAAMASDSDLRAQERKLRAKSPVGALPDNWTVLARFMHADAMLAEGNK